jgi:hypothetical protein
VRARYREHIDHFLPAHDSEWGYARGQFEAVLKFMEEQDLSHELASFRRHTLAVDALREERFADVFPELAELVAE